LQLLSTLNSCCPLKPPLLLLLQARSLGMAIVTSSPKEHAEHYCQQLWQRGCKVSMEPDTTTL